FGDEVEIEVIRRGGRTGLRILEPSAPRLTGLTGVPTYPYDPELAVTGIWTTRPAMVTVGAALPCLERELPAPGAATAEMGDRGLDLVLTGEASILVAVGTSGSTSAVWRVVNAELDGEAIRLDLNYAVNPPAAFS